MDYSILVIDDDEPIHIMAKNMFGKEFSLLHAKNAQNGIDILSESKVNLVISDIHMPGLSGLEFLQSLMSDADKKQIPVLIMTNLPTVEKEKKALDLGAADFLDKSLFVNDKEEILERVRMKLVTNINLPNLGEDLSNKKNKLITKLMEKALKNDFKTTAQTLCEELEQQFEAQFVSLWSVDKGEPQNVISLGQLSAESYTTKELKSEFSFSTMLEQKEPYMSNHVFNDDEGIMVELSEAQGLPAEIGVPLFAVNERNLLMNDMSVPEDAPVFGFLVIKRNKLFSSKEFDMISRFLIQSGSILWRLFSK